MDLMCYKADIEKLQKSSVIIDLEGLNNRSLFSMKICRRIKFSCRCQVRSRNGETDRHGSFQNDSFHKLILKQFLGTFSAQSNLVWKILTQKIFDKIHFVFQNFRSKHTCKLFLVKILTKLLKKVGALKRTPHSTG